MTNMEPGRNPPRYQHQPDQRQSVNYSGWIVGVVAALAVIAAIAYGMSDRSRIANTSAPDTTTGQSDSPPGTPRPGPPATNR